MPYRADNRIQVCKTKNCPVLESWAEALEEHNRLLGAKVGKAETEDEKFNHSEKRVSFSET
jgi:hypothetical protein